MRSKKCIQACLLFTIGITALASLFAQPQSPSTYAMPDQDTYLKLAAEMETTLQRDVLDVWFPRSVDKEAGGFYSDFTRDWQRTKSEGKFSVFQGRMVWVAAQVMMQRPKL